MISHHFPLQIEDQIEIILVYLRSSALASSPESHQSGSVIQHQWHEKLEMLPDLIRTGVVAPAQRTGVPVNIASHRREAANFAAAWENTTTAT